MFQMCVASIRVKRRNDSKILAGMHLFCLFCVNLFQKRGRTDNLVNILKTMCFQLITVANLSKVEYDKNLDMDKINYG